MNDKLKNEGKSIGQVVKEWSRGFISREEFSLIIISFMIFSMGVLLIIGLLVLGAYFDVKLDEMRFQSLYDECIVREFTPETCLNFAITNGTFGD